MDSSDRSPQIDPPEEALNDDALFTAPPEPDDATLFHDANADSKDNALLSTPTQTESLASIPTLSLPPYVPWRADQSREKL